MPNNIWRKSPSNRLNSSELIRYGTGDATSDIAVGFFESLNYYGILKRWTGSAWARVKLEVYSGGSFVDSTVKRWDSDSGTWKIIDTSG